MGDWLKENFGNGIPFVVKFDTSSTLMLALALFTALTLSMIVAGKLVKS